MIVICCNFIHTTSFFLENIKAIIVRLIQVYAYNIVFTLKDLFT